MPRSRIRLVLTFLSLLLTAAVLALWTRSLTVADWLQHSHATTLNGRYARTEWIVASAPGFLSLINSNRVPADDASARWLQDMDRQTPLGWSFGPVDSYPPSWSIFASGLMRFGIDSGADQQGRTHKVWRSIELPDWVLLCIVSAPAQVSLFRLVRSRHEENNGDIPHSAQKAPNKFPQAHTSK